MGLDRRYLLMNGDDDIYFENIVVKCVFFKSVFIKGVFIKSVFFKVCQHR